ncbi:acetyl-CoA carboxylase biotin carboxyl carrier protein [Polycladomyces sp. WAk]|uniref:Biotin carboxyl carrier protein of acetyl-CoA carboxylase n=1 Tax=Polycladomyces zharkentensis TaxID=2807616 RepID=A0ABS2WK41_9BACL|nr:acetyl-CoA carboxylase biotin carboxyl carrier protein [Polycladomyces sp. WAk]MBN2909836.1 acetyl-CoA carboxylase biotin carboxyl carrier protein [Polycladomyces sp. WAk]
MQFRVHEFRELIKLIHETDIELFEFEKDGNKLVIKKGPKGQTTVVNQPAAGQPEPIVPTPPPAPQAPLPAPQPAAEQPAPAKPEQKPAEEEDANLHKIVSPMVGTFYRAPAPDADPYVKEGDQVEENTVVCIVEAMKLMNEIEAEVRGTIVKVLVENGQLVEYGQPLFLVKTT